MLPQSSHVQQVYYAGKHSLLSADPEAAGEKRTRLFIECSTIDPTVTRDVAARVAASGLGDFSDAAVSVTISSTPFQPMLISRQGGPFGAREGSLSHMIGCDDRVVDKVKSVVSMTGKSLFHCGPVGSGVTVKIINNYIAITNMLSASEGLAMGVKMGIDPKKLTDIINASSGMSWCTLKNNPVPGVQPDSTASRGYKGGFAIELATGCIDLAVKGAEDCGAKLALGTALQEAWHMAQEDPRCRGLDARSIYRWISEDDV